MTYTIEVLLRGETAVSTETAMLTGNAPAAWTAADAAAVVRSMLLALDRAQNPDRVEEPAVTLRGFNWVVTPHEEGVAIALETHSAAVVAGPFEIPHAQLEQLLTRAISLEQPGPTVH
ncbi:MAG: hypothetical protein GEU99_16670 [Luteitalea sp.]|nr:hypothetical protein [Luteitalea sp.]